MYKAIKSYQNVSVESELESANPYRVTQLLMEGCLKFMAQAKGAIERKDYEAKSELVSKAQSIVNALMLTLDRNQNPEVSDNLLALYDYINDRLLAASVEMDVAKIDEAAKVMLEIKAGWDAIPQSAIAEALANKATKKQDENAHR